MKQEVANLLKRLDITSKIILDSSDSSESDEDLPIATIQNRYQVLNDDVSFSERLDEALTKKMSNRMTVPPVTKTENLEAQIKNEMDTFQKSGQRGTNLQLAFDFLSTIPPTSVESERCFSSAGLIVTKFRSAMGDDTIDNIIFLRYFFKNME